MNLYFVVVSYRTAAGNSSQEIVMCRADSPKMAEWHATLKADINGRTNMEAEVYRAQKA